jgi:hypothetical protein
VTCPSLETIVAWFLREIDDAKDGRIEEHLFSCDRCAKRTADAESLVRRLRAMFPVVLTPERRERAQKSVSPLPIVEVSPGASATIEFHENTEFGFWVLHSDLSDVRRVDCDLLTFDSAPLVSFPDVPFDPDRQEVVLGCQVHYRALDFPTDIVARVTATTGGGQRRTAEYRLSHRYLDA